MESVTNNLILAMADEIKQLIKDEVARKSFKNAMIATWKRFTCRSSCCGGNGCSLAPAEEVDSKVLSVLKRHCSGEYLNQTSAV